MVNQDPPPSNALVGEPFKVTCSPDDPYLTVRPSFYPDAEQAKRAAVRLAGRHRGAAHVYAPGDHRLGSAVYYPQAWPPVQWREARS